MFLFLCIIFFVSCFGHRQTKYISDVYPKAISMFEVRRDRWSNQTVTSGLFRKMKKDTLAAFRRKLQCNQYEPNINYNNGLISAFRLAPVTVTSIEMYCAYRETHNPRCPCYETRCGNYKEWPSRLQRGEYINSSQFNFLNNWSPTTILVRVIQGQLHYDWPWGAHRYDLSKESKHSALLPLLKGTVKHISDIGDSVFFIGGDSPTLLPMDNMPVPSFSHTATEAWLDLVFPWKESWRMAVDLSRKFRMKNLAYTEASYQLLEPGYREWDKRIGKAAFFGEMFRERQFMFDIARHHPELFDARFSSKELCFEPWNPSSRERCPNNEHFFKTPKGKARVAYAPPGYYAPLRNISKPATYSAGAYKYVIVPLGLGPGVSVSTSARIQHLLTSSGAVILMPRSSYTYHFSAQLRPWVHYVPLSYSGADALEKVQWLVEHDEMARQIAENGRNFARSYLRLEDYYCYVAASLNAMAEIAKLSNITKVLFNPKKF